MRFTIATIALYASLAAAAVQNGADSTVYQTDEVTVISCAPTVTDCPGRQTSTPAAGVEPTTTPAGVEPTTTPAGVEPTGSPAPSGPVPSGPASSGWSSVPAPPAVTPSTGAPQPPAVTPVQSYSMTTFTSCVPTVITSQVPVPSTPGGGSPRRPRLRCGTSPVSPSGTPAFNGAGALSGSLTFAGAAAAAAFFLA
ncbi:uncharacterized protein N7469_011504 [Penicillium citrinum]|uniref:GPI anchored serine-rich protein n=1 Tax=Penicillium citrinum TaxID=5077 RepID=A0A9W9TCY6_PENCI|nr:uncharacterized protein N7469_011504 [Penicillium citrinum]KAJ5217879.1 hypothetical protein N7469_011504 [Penicillium citrinum]